MYDILKEFSLNNNIPFDYGRHDFLNLFNEIEQKNIPYIFLEPVTTSEKRNDTNIVIEREYSGNFMILFSSDIDEESYTSRYEKYIKEALGSILINLEIELSCKYYAKFLTWKKTEIINIFDYNMDGIIVNYNIAISER